MHNLNSKQNMINEMRKRKMHKLLYIVTLTTLLSILPTHASDLPKVEELRINEASGRGHQFLVDTAALANELASMSKSKEYLMDPIPIEPFVNSCLSNLTSESMAESKVMLPNDFTFTTQEYQQYKQCMPTLIKFIKMDGVIPILSAMFELTRFACLRNLQLLGGIHLKFYPDVSIVEDERTYDIRELWTKPQLLVADPNISADDALSSAISYLKAFKESIKKHE